MVKRTKAEPKAGATPPAPKAKKKGGLPRRSAALYCPLAVLGVAVAAAAVGFSTGWLNVQLTRPQVTRPRALEEEGLTGPSVIKHPPPDARQGPDASPENEPPSPPIKASSPGKAVKVTVENKGTAAFDIYWDPETGAHATRVISDVKPGAQVNMNAFAGHMFAFRALTTGRELGR